MQIKGRGTRRHDFASGIIERSRREAAGPRPKAGYKLFDFFANCEYFEEKFDYDEVIALPRGAEAASTSPEEAKKKFPPEGAFTHEGPDALASLETTVIGPGGMKIDRMYFRGFEDRVRLDPEARRRYEAGDWEGLVDYVTRNLFGKAQGVLRPGAPAQGPARRPQGLPARAPRAGVRRHTLLEEPRGGRRRGFRPL